MAQKVTTGTTVGKWKRQRITCTQTKPVALRIVRALKHLTMFPNVVVERNKIRGWDVFVHFEPMPSNNEYLSYCQGVAEGIRHDHGDCCK